MMVLNSEFTEFEKFNAFAAEWDIDFRQVSSGLLNSSLVQIVTNNHSISRARFDQLTYQQGATVPGMRTFAFLDIFAPDVDWCGFTFSPDSVAIFARDRDFRCVSPPGFFVYTLSFTEEELAAASHRLGFPNICARLNTHAEIRTIDRRSIQGLCKRVNETISSVVTPGTSVFSKDKPRDFPSGQIAEQLVSALTAAESVSGYPSPNKLTAATNRTLQYIEAHLADRPTIQDILEVAGVSRRTLEYAFRRQLDMSPKSFINQQRMTLVRRDLRKVSAEKPIADIANYWGYWHMGQFARDYQRQFGELPSDTVRCHR
ncbi:helix-turn-helix domain-containing protein [Pseudomonadota bacterium]